MKNYFRARRKHQRAVAPGPAPGSEHRVCACGREFTVASSKAKKVWCTDACYQRAWRKRAS